MQAIPPPRVTTMLKSRKDRPSGGATVEAPDQGAQYCPHHQDGAGAAAADGEISRSFDFSSRINADSEYNHYSQD